MKGLSFFFLGGSGGILKVQKSIKFNLYCFLISNYSKCIIQSKTF